MLYDEYISVEVLELCEPQSRRILPGLLRELHPSPAEPFAFTAHVVYGETDARLAGSKLPVASQRWIPVSAPGGQTSTQWSPELTRTANPNLSRYHSTAFFLSLTTTATVFILCINRGSLTD